MTTEFDAALLTYFGATVGAFSKVTRTEFGDSQVTLTGAEKTIAENFLGERLKGNHGSVRSIVESGGNPIVAFRKFPTGEIVELNLIYKTGANRELRLYLAAGRNFKPNEGDYWGIFVRENEIWLCSFSDWMLQEMLAGKIPATPQFDLLDAETDDFQAVVNKMPGKISSISSKWARNPGVSIEALEKSGYKCEIEPNLPTFESRSTGNPFLEAHHLVPMMLQGEFKTQSLDRIDNICVLHPLIHRKVHFAPLREIESTLLNLISKRQNLLIRLGLVEDDIISFYK